MAGTESILHFSRLQVPGAQPIGDHWLHSELLQSVPNLAKKLTQTPRSCLAKRDWKSSSVSSLTTHVRTRWDDTSNELEKQPMPGKKPTLSRMRNLWAVSLATNT
eukprot:2682453-Amphidinium_carterae.1